LDTNKKGIDFLEPRDNRFGFVDRAGDQGYGPLTGVDLSFDVGPEGWIMGGVKIWKKKI